jgi:hypothetical protein
VVHFLVFNFIGPELLDILALLASIGPLVGAAPVLATAVDLALRAGA